jgi:hypothetical protein
LSAKASLIGVIWRSRVNNPMPLRRPAVFACALAALLAAAALLGVGLAQLAARRDAAPNVVAVDKADLEAALAAAPWTSSGDGGERVLWLVTAPDCAPCRAFERDDLPRLLGAGVEVRAILIAPRALALASQGARDVAMLTKERDWDAVHAWMLARRDPANDQMDAAEEDGMLEWGRQSAERIAGVLKRNDIDFRTPALFWKRGAEWRASVKGDVNAFRAVTRALTEKAQSGV